MGEGTFGAEMISDNDGAIGGCVMTRTNSPTGVLIHRHTDVLMRQQVY